MRACVRWYGTQYRKSAIFSHRLLFSVSRFYTFCSPKFPLNAASANLPSTFNIHKVVHGTHLLFLPSTDFVSLVLFIYLFYDEQIMHIHFGCCSIEMRTTSKFVSLLYASVLDSALHMVCQPLTLFWMCISVDGIIHLASQLATVVESLCLCVLARVRIGMHRVIAIVLFLFSCLFVCRQRPVNRVHSVSLGSNQTVPHHYYIVQRHIFIIKNAVHHISLSLTPSLASFVSPCWRCRSIKSNKWNCIRFHWHTFTTIAVFAILHILVYIVLVYWPLADDVSATQTVAVLDRPLRMSVWYGFIVTIQMLDVCAWHLVRVTR